MTTPRDDDNRPGEELEATQAPVAEAAREREAEARDRAPEDRTVEDWEALIAFQRNRAESNFNGWQRAQADYANHKRRADQERAEALRYGSLPALAHVLSITDDLERALNALPLNLTRLTWVEGVVIIYRKMLAMLEASGVTEIEAEGRDFDPSVHEAIAQTDGPEGQVVQVVQKGYQLYDRVLRPSLVQVGNGVVVPPDGGDGSGDVQQNDGTTDTETAPQPHAEAPGDDGRTQTQD